MKKLNFSPSCSPVFKFNLSILICQFSIVFLLLFLCSCQQKWVSGQESKIKNFPPQMVGVWVAEVGYTDAEKYGIKFEADGSISKIVHNVMGPVAIKDGGTSGEGPDKGTYFEFIMGPTMVEYNPLSKLIYVEINIDKYEMKLPQGELKGRIVDKFKGKVSDDGKTLDAEWRCYGWLEGAQEPNIKEIDNSSEKIIFKKIDLTDPNATKSFNN